LGILSIVAIPALSGMREDAMIANERTKIATVRTGLVALRDKMIMTMTNISDYIDPATLSTLSRSLNAMLIRIEYLSGESYFIAFQRLSDCGGRPRADPQGPHPTIPYYSPQCLGTNFFPTGLNVTYVSRTTDRHLHISIEEAVRNGKYYPLETVIGLEMSDIFARNPQLTASNLYTDFHMATLTPFLHVDDRKNMRVAHQTTLERVGVLTNTEINKLPYVNSSGFLHSYIFGEATMNITDPTKELCRGKVWQYDPGDGSIKLVGECLDN
jgi:hypothetical protein